MLKPGIRALLLLLFIVLPFYAQDGAGTFRAMIVPDSERQPLTKEITVTVFDAVVVEHVETTKQHQTYFAVRY
jgi:hypothetical protein